MQWALVNRRVGASPWGVLLAGLAGIVFGVLTLLWPGRTAPAVLYLIAALSIVVGIVLGFRSGK